eukprot:SAG11_NODE_11746_length_740_cov_1.257410_2_plen_53_part_01
MPVAVSHRAENQRRLHAAVREDDRVALEQLLARGVSPDGLDERRGGGIVPLHV